MHSTLLMAKTKTMVLVFSLSFPFLPVSKEKVALVVGKRGFSFWFSFWPKKGAGVVLPLLTLECTDGLKEVAA